MAGYIKIGDIKGESTDQGHKDWINLLSVSQGLSRPMRAGTSGSTRQRASVDCGDLVMVKEVDSSTPKLIEACCDGTVFPEVKVDLCTSSGGDSRIPYYQWTLTNVHVTSYDCSGGAQDGQIPTESLALNYEEIRWTYTKMGKDGAVAGKVESGWRVEEGVKA